MDQRNSSDAQCPFFRAHTKESVICEGVIPDSQSVVRFEDEKSKQTQYSIFCCWRYQNCEMYQAVQNRYREEE